MADLATFARRMRLHGLNIERNANLVARAVAIEIASTVIDRTPVDTGKTRSNWQAALDGPAQGVWGAYSPGKGGSTGEANSNAAKLAVRTVAGAKRPGQAIHITNNMPNIRKLNDGSSDQAPASFVENAILEVVTLIPSYPGIVTGNYRNG